jgi:hypothetical protein
MPGVRCTILEDSNEEKLMASGFPRDQVTELLKACHRRCCICHRFCGVKIETDHIIPAADGGPDTIDNAIPVCFECHSEIHSYNDKHPRGRKFLPEELRGHKQQWLAICKNRPEVFINAARNADVGPLQALIDELEFNAVVADHTAGPYVVGCKLHDEQFRRAISEGSIATLHETLKQSILEAYRAVGYANHLITATSQSVRVEEKNNAMVGVREALTKIVEARDALLEFLGSEK